MNSNFKAITHLCDFLRLSFNLQARFPGGGGRNQIHLPLVSNSLKNAGRFCIDSSFTAELQS